MRNVKISIAIFAAAALGLPAGAAEIASIAKGRSCQDFFVGQMHIQGRVAREKAEEHAKANVEYKIQKECDAKKGTFTLRSTTYNCGPFEDQGVKDFFTHSVCVSCEATAKGDCT